MKKLTAIITAAILCVSLTACGEIKKAEKSVNDIFSAIKSADFEKIAEYAEIENYNEEDMKQAEPIFKAISENFDYKILSSEQNDDDAVTVKAEITVSDLSSFFKEYVGKAMEYSISNFSALLSGEISEEQQKADMERIITESLESADLSNLVTNEIALKVVRGEDNRWKAQIDEASTTTLFKGLFGDVYNSLGDMGNSFNQQAMDEAMKAVTPADFGGYVQGDGLNPSDTMAADAQRQMNEMQQQQMNSMNMMN